MINKITNKYHDVDDDIKNLKETDLLPKETYGIRHLIECNCILPQFKDRKPVVWHKFQVFSIIDENNEVTSKFAQCNNCGIIHKVIEIGKSEITTKENLRSIRTIKEIKIGMQQDIAGLLEQYNMDVAVWEEAEFILRNKIWGSMIILGTETEDGVTVGKALVFQGEPVLARIESFSRQDFVK
jgi:hypothetical protein